MDSIKNHLPEFGSNIFSIFIYSLVVFIAFTLIYIPISLFANFFGYCLIPEGTESCVGLENPLTNGLVLGYISGTLTFLGGIYSLGKDYITKSTLGKILRDFEKKLTFWNVLIWSIIGLIVFGLILVVFAIIFA